MVCPWPIGNGVSVAPYGCKSKGKNLDRGSDRSALITLAERSVPCLVRLSMSLSQSDFSNKAPLGKIVDVPF